MPAVDDRALLARAQSSAAGFGELFDAYYDRIYAYAYRRVGSSATAEDIASCVFEDALRGIKRVRWEGKPIVAWLYRIAARRVADHYRGHRAEASLGPEIPGADGKFDEIERSEEYDSLRLGLERLSQAEREVIRLAFFDELTGAEIAALLRCSKNAAYVRLHRAMKKLEAVLLEDQAGTR